MARKFGFAEMIIDMVWRILSNNWYSVLVNGTSHDFFQSSRGVKQGDPLSPTLFIIAAEVLSRGLNSLHRDETVKGYGLPKWSPKINHLSYADDTILFGSGDRGSIIKMMRILRDYEVVSGQKVNKSKSFFYLHDNTPLIVAIRLRRLTGIRQGNFPFIYLGCPVFYGRRKSSYYEVMVQKIAKRILTWHNRFLTFGGKWILINNVLQSMPVYMLSALNPPKKVLDQIHQIFAKFFWGNFGGIKGKHWVTWGDLCYPKEEGGLGFRSLHDVNKALFAKLWWNFRVSTNSLWARYMWNKYCKKLHPVITTSLGASQVWRKMITVREEVEHDIRWQLKAGNSSFWFDNWTRQGALYYTEGDLAQDVELEVKDFITNGMWDETKLKICISEEMADHIIFNIRPRIMEIGSDKAWWSGNTTGLFTVKSAYHRMRSRKAEEDWRRYMWIRGMPIKISFFLWRVWRGKIATDDNLKKMKIPIVSKCYCCEKGEMETMKHLLLTAPIAQKLWKQFASCAGININGLTLQQLIFKWWEHKASTKVQQILQAVPAVIMWELWKRRNSYKHGKKVSYTNLYYQCQLIIYQLVRTKFPWIKRMPYHWPQVLDRLQSYKPTLHYQMVSWRKPSEGWVTCNTDGASKGNPGVSSYGYCIRDMNGDLIYAEAHNLGETTNMEAEATAVWKALQYCLDNGVRQVRLETDSLALKNMIYGSWSIPWEIVEKVEDIQEKMQQLNVQVWHVFREANQLADFIANTTIITEQKIIFQHFHQLPSLGKKILNIDKHQVPSVRIKTKRIYNNNNCQHA